MSPTLSPLVRRLLALTIFVVLVVACYGMIVQPLIDSYADNRAIIDQLQVVLAGYQRAANALPLRQRELAALKERPAAAEGFLQGTSDTLLAAQIQNRIKQTADAAKAELKSSQVLPAETDGKLNRIAVREQITATTAGLLDIFHDIEAQSPFLFLDNVVMQVQPSSLRDRNGPGRGDVIDVQVDAYGYSRGKG